MLRPAIITPTYRGPEPLFVDCLVNLVATWPSKPVPPYRTVVCGDPAFGMYTGIRSMMNEGLMGETDGVLSIEHDHAFLTADAVALLEGAKVAGSRAVVGGLYYQRMTDALVGEIVGAADLHAAVPSYSCKTVGLGFTWIPWEVLRLVPEPWFDPRWEPVNGKWTRESHDAAFCRELRHLEIPIYGVILKGLLHRHEVPPRGVKVKA